MRFIWLFVLKSIVTLGCNLNNLPASPDSYFAQTAVFRGLYNTEELRSAHAEYEDFYSLFEGTPMQVLTDIELAIQNDDLETAAILLNGLSTDDLNYIEENYRTLYTLCLAYKSTEGLNESQKLELETLCALCPETDGACIYQARALYMLVNGEPYEATLCTDDEGGRKAFYPDEEQKNNRGRVKAIVYPNPTMESVTIKLSRKCDGLNLSVHDVSGRLVLIKEFENKANLYHLQFDFEPGIYFITLSDGFNNFTKKIIVAR